MNRNRKLQTISVAAIVLTVVMGVALVVGTGRTRKTTGSDREAVAADAKKKDREAVLKSLLQAQVKHERRKNPWGNKWEDRKEWSQRGRRFGNLYLTRHESDVVSDLIPFLQDTDENRRDHAAQILGELENARAEAPLQAKLQGAETYNERLRKQPKKMMDEESQEEENLIAPLTLKLALGRIRSRNVKGKAKLNKVAQSVDLTYDEVVQLAQMFGAQIRSEDAPVRQAAVRSSGYRILTEFIDLLHTMGRRGEDIQALGASGLAVVPGFEMRLRGATMSLEEEIEMILDHATSPGGGTFPEYYLLSLGPRATEMLIDRLEDIARQPDKYKLGASQAIGNGYVNLFRAAAMTGDPRVIPLLRQFQKHPHAHVRSYAIQTLYLIEDGTLPQRSAG